MTPLLLDDPVSDSIALGPAARAVSSLTRDYSGVVINQDVAPATGSSTLAAYVGVPVYQDFFLPDDYRRGTDDGELRWPALSGFQVLVTVADGFADQAALEWTVDRFELGTGWIPQASGVAIGAPADGRVWMTVYLDRPLEVIDDTVRDRYRFSVAGRLDGSVAPVQNAAVDDYDGVRAVVEGVVVPARLVPGVKFPFELAGVPSYLLYDDVENKVVYSTQAGIETFWYSSPNPLADIGNARAERPAGTPVDDGGDVSLLFRVLGLVADEGIDFLGNPYRGVVVWRASDHVTTDDVSLSDKFYVSDPCPSKFGVKSLYFDNRDVDGEASTFDRLLLDPITPDVYFHVYYTDEGPEPHPGITEQEWEERVWKAVPGSFKMVQRTTHAMPKPITAKYVKIECSHLQAHSYAPGVFARPVTYKKHPKWVLDYFLARTETTENFDPRTVTLVYDALDLAYNYYLDDLQEAPDDPAVLGTDDAPTVLAYLRQRDDVSDQIDNATLAQINLEMAPWVQDIRFRARYDYLPSTLAIPEDNQPSEVVTTTANLPFSSSMTEPVVFEQSFPVTFFFVDCRHRYREVRASFKNDRAYFVAIREIAFLRDRYTIANDANLYIESAGDNVNVDRNDFARETGGRWVVPGG